MPEAQVVVSSTAKTNQRDSKSIHVTKKSKKIFGKDGGGIFGEIFKESPAQRPVGASKDKDDSTTQHHPYNMKDVGDLTDANEYHATCVSIKTAATVGIGFKTETEDDIQSKVEKKLDPFTEDTFQAILNAVCEDLWITGNGYMEIVRGIDGKGDEISGIHHIAAYRTFVVTEDKAGEFHFEVRGGELQGASTAKIYARFGELEETKKRLAKGVESVTTDDIGEIIHFKVTSPKNKYYGYADWLAAVPSIELNQMFTQYLFDFFLNRGVPEFMLFITGGVVSVDDWAIIEKSLMAQIGIANSHKSIAINLSNPELKVELIKLAMDQASNNTFKEDSETTALKIVTAHKVPPLLAGIQISGKLGATNELPNALVAFQILTIGPRQKAITTTLINTLGMEQGLGLSPKDFKLKSIIDELNLDVMTTVGGMRQTVPEAAAEGRNLNGGMKD